MSVKKHFKTPVRKDLFALVAGVRIGKGVYREVYDYLPDNTCVLKVETNSRSFCNVKEWEIWEEVRYMKANKWFAPCVTISPCGIFLVQKKTEKWMKAYPKKLPAVLRDLKMDNVGMYNDHFCFHDYGNSSLVTASLRDKFNKVEWYR